MKKIIREIAGFIKEEEEVKESKGKEDLEDEKSENSDSVDDDVNFQENMSTEDFIKILEKSSINGLAGYKQRMLLTRITKEVAYIGFLISDFFIYLKEIKILPLSQETYKKLRTLQYVCWLLKCIMGILYQIVELKHLREFLETNKSVYMRLMSNKIKINTQFEASASEETSKVDPAKVSSDMKNIIKKMHLLKKNYYIRSYTLIYRVLDIPYIWYQLSYSNNVVRNEKIDSILHQIPKSDIMTGLSIITSSIL
mmetsp:Transcript_9012/g.10182  ORF Transcript_9012/g.10182 Transcript_9012/m.10182 type:complete len:254 (+) Transcript_9012:150-911(+)